jgi:N-acetylglutamate synthase-like GNAT family acetyltransferase
VVDRLHTSMRHWYRLVGGASPGARAIERHGVLAAVLPAAPERAVANAVVYDNADGLAAAYDEVADAYAEIGASWTVWVHHGDSDAAALLAERGHFLDAEPEAMGLDLRDGVERPPALEDWTASGDPAHVGPLNDRAYDFGTDSFTRAFAGLDREAVRVYLARQDGNPVACALIVDHETNAELQTVAVVPEARGRGLAGRLLGHALADAAERGMETSTLIATKLGRPTYERLGFRPLGALQMWERRVGER